MEEKKKYAAPAVERVLDVLEVMVQHNRNYTATEMANILNVSVNSIFRIFIELEKKQYVVKDTTNSSYSLTPKMYYMGNAIKSRISLVSIAEPYLKRVWELTNETAVLTTLQEDYRTLVVDQIESNQPLKCLSTVGLSYASYVSSMGKVMIANLPKEKIDEYVNNNEFTKLTDNTITNPEDFLKELELAKKDRVGYDRQESIPGLVCVASPILSAGGKVEGAIGITGIVFRMNEEKLAKDAIIIKEQAAKLSSALGYLDK